MDITDRIRSRFPCRLHFRIILVPEPSNGGVTPVCCGLVQLDPVHGVLGADRAVDCVEAERDAGKGEEKKEEEEEAGELLSHHVCAEYIKRPV